MTRRRKHAPVVPMAMTAGLSILTALLSAAPAHADGTGTVKVKTQRMSDSTLESHQEGWYKPGEKLKLVCHKRGQNVKGYFSPYIPGAWDNLWYRTSDGHFVADVDIETGTLDPVAPACGGGGSAPAPPAPAASSKADAALAKAMGMVGTNAYGDVGCGRFVAAAYGVPGIGYATALQFRNALASKGKIHMPGSAAPKGALVFSRSSYDGGAGHVDIARGDGTYVSGGVDRSYHGVKGGGHNVQVLSSPNPARDAVDLGWAVAPW